MRFHAFRDFEDGTIIDGLGFDIVVHRRSVGSINLPSGQLIACDPLHALDTEPFALELTPGRYPVHLLVAELRDERRNAYAVVRVGEGPVRRWESAELSLSAANHDQARPSLLDTIDEDPGYPVDSSLGCFTDARTASALIDYQQIVMPEDNDFERLLLARLRKRRRGGPGFGSLDLRRDLKLPMPEGLNLIAFDTGFGPGHYVTYVGLDEEGEVVSVVTDFQVLDLRFPSFPLPKMSSFNEFE
ncbi:hypothetical protein DL240_13860 [Lujinxingia litoralis]|uniref:DUF4241 domain-containing protein n=1 Tax=Lujinxingia litoralis TaxID=2211119 RepID=A0A328C332_9DELT|nr:DUF4241 domain-containing protein [Lujinxingia litoralis]RAL21213.1 hypothetical protein DL240_13860 [Lujinxingia litoralis]